MMASQEYHAAVYLVEKFQLHLKSYCGVNISGVVYHGITFPAISPTSLGTEALAMVQTMGALIRCCQVASTLIISV